MLNSLSKPKYFPSISVDQYNWVRNPFVKFELCQWQFTLKEDEELVSIASDRMLKLKHAELNLDTFWILVENEYRPSLRKICNFCCSFQLLICANSDFLLWPPSNTRIVYLTGWFLLIPLIHLMLDWINFGTVKILYMLLEHSCREPLVVVKCCVRNLSNLVYCKVISRCGHRGFGLCS